MQPRTEVCRIKYSPIYRKPLFTIAGFIQVQEFLVSLSICSVKSDYLYVVNEWLQWYAPPINIIIIVSLNSERQDKKAMKEERI